MSPRARLWRTFGSVTALSFALGAGGCAMDDVQFNGGIFDAVGLSDQTKTKSGEPKMSERAPLVVPPKLDRLPQPGEQPAPASQLAEINDHDAEEQRSKEELEKAQQEYCDKHYREHDASTDSVAGPLGPCRKSVLTAIQKWNSE